MKRILIEYGQNIKKLEKKKKKKKERKSWQKIETAVPLWEYSPSFVFLFLHLKKEKCV